MDYLKEFGKNLAYYFSALTEYPFARPYWIYISLSHECTYNCQMCGVVKILKGYSLSQEVVEKALDEISRWEEDCVVLFTGGEPFLRKNIFELIRHSTERGIKTEVVSNGALIDETLARRIVSSSLQNIAVSLDGATSSTHDFIREKGSFAKATRALKNLVEAKKSIGRGPQISAWTTIMKENVSELSDIMPLVRDLGVECLVYHPVIVAQDDMQRTSPDASFWINKDNLAILKGQIDKITEYQNKSGLVSFLHDPYLWLNYFEGTLMKKDWKCNPFVFINIGPDGELRSCGSSFGNINTMSLEECLQSEESFEARRIMNNCQKPCLQTCWAHPESNSLKEIVERFIDNTKGDSNKVRLLREAMKLLEHYEKNLAECKKWTR